MTVSIHLLPSLKYIAHMSILSSSLVPRFCPKNMKISFNAKLLYEDVVEIRLLDMMIIYVLLFHLSVFLFEHQHEGNKLSCLSLFC